MNQGAVMCDSAVRILLVEDNPGDARLLREAIRDAEGLSFELTHVERLDEAIKQLEAQTFDVLLLDLSLPDSEGSDTVKRITAVAPRIPVVVLTGIDDTDVGTEMVRCGAQDFLVKGQTDHRLLTRAIRYAIERKRGEEALRVSEMEFRTLTEAMPQIVWATRPDGWNIYFNQQWMDYTGMTLEESYGHGWNIPVHPDDKQRAWDAWQRATQNDEPYSLECRLRRADGVYRWWLTHATPLRDERGKILKWLGTCTDIQEIKKTEEALRQSERVYRAIGESIEYGIWICDAQGRNTYASESLLKLVGITKEQCADFGWGDVLHPDDAEATIAAWKQCVQEGVHWYREHRYRGVDGQYHPILACGVPVHDERGQITCWAGINLDISRLKNAEQALKDADRKKDEFLAMLAHELRNPMAAISAAATLLCRPDVSQDKAQLARDSLKDRVSQLGRLIDDLLDVSRITRGKIKLQKESLDLELVIARAVDSSRSFFEDRRQKLEVLVADPLPVFGDPVRLEQIITNLLTNASRYSYDGQVTTLRAFREGKEAVIQVKDSGIGIDASLMPDIFKTFTQAENTLARTRGGLGLGLSIVKNLSEMHGGSVSVKSEGEGKGAEFEVRLPITETNMQNVVQEKKRRFPRALHILIAEDNRDTAMLQAAMLELEGHIVEIVGDGLSAVDKAFRMKPDVILLDIGLPGLSGYEVAQNVRQAGLIDTLIIALSGYGQEQDIKRACESGMDEHLLKPVEYEKLIALLLRCERKKKEIAANDA